MARLKKAESQSDEQIAKDMNWMAQGRKQRTPPRSPSPGQQLDWTQSNKRKIATYFANDGTAKRRKTVLEAAVDGATGADTNPRKRGLSMPSTKSKRKQLVEIHGHDTFDVPDDSRAESSKSSKSIGTIGSRLRSSRISKNTAIPTVEAHTEADPANEVDMQPDSSDTQGEESIDSERDPQAKLKRAAMFRKAIEKASDVDQEVQGSSSGDSTHDNGDAYHTSESGASVHERSNSPKTSVTGDPPAEILEPAILNDDDETDLSSVLQEVVSGGNEGVELFGASAAWTSLCRGAQLVGVSKRSRETNQDIPELVTDEIANLVQTSRRITRLYEKIAEISGSDEAQSIELESQLSNEVTRMRDIIDGLREDGTDSWNVSAIQDIYAHAIRKAVPMLGQALSARSGVYSQEKDVECIQEIISLQTLILQLCEKARRWKAQPDTDRPIKNPTRQLIYPQLRDKLLPSFKRELEQRKHRRRLVEISQARSDDGRESLGALEEEEEKARIIAENNGRLHQALDRNEELLRIRRGCSRPVQGTQTQISHRQSLSYGSLSSQKRHPPGPRKLWTREEDRVFLKCLLDPKFKGVTPQGRYLCMLHAKELQEKNEGLLKGRVLYYQEKLLANAKYRPYVESLLETS